MKRIRVRKVTSIITEDDGCTWALCTGGEVGDIVERGIIVYGNRAELQALRSFYQPVMLGNFIGTSGTGLSEWEFSSIEEGAEPATKAKHECSCLYCDR